MLGFAVVLILSNRPLKTPEGLPLITDAASYNDAIRQEAAISEPIFAAFDRGEDVSDQDKAQLRKAARIADSANVLRPEKAGLYLESGRAYLILGDLDLADQRLQQCISNSRLQNADIATEGVSDAYFLLSQVRAQQGLWKDSLALATQADKMRPDVATYLTGKASAELQLKMIVEAKKDLSSALKIDPTYRRALQLQKLMDMAPAK